MSSIAIPRLRLNLERLLQVVVASMTVVATMLFSAGQRSGWLSWVAILLAAGSVWLCDVTGRVRLPASWANVLSLIAVVVWLGQTLILHGNEQLVAVSYVLLGLQAIMLMQPKNQSRYWQLLVLSMAQAAVAAAMTPGLWFGVLLMLYTTLGFVALALMYMRRELGRFGQTADAGLADSNRDSAIPSVRVLPAGRAALHFSSGAAPLAEDSWQQTLSRQATAIASGTLLTTLVIFLLFPRVEREPDAFFEDGSRTVGFSKDVTVGDESGNASQDPNTVLRVQFFSGDSNEPMQLIGEPLLRGAVASQYDQGRWRQTRANFTRPVEVLRGKNFVREQITIEPQDDVTLFAVTPSYVQEEEERFDFRGEELVRRRGLRSQRMNYELVTTGIVERRQEPLIPITDPYGHYSRREDYLLRLPAPIDGRDPLAGLRETADRVRQEAGLDVSDRMGIARALERYLRESGQYTYSLEGQKRDANVDPLEDFVVTHRRGHCEYFAGALALMLRSQGIPARIAIGFRAGEWNSAGGYYQVRQLHAHTWVEALLKPQHLGDQKLNFNSEHIGAWLTLDATPGGESALGDASGEGLWNRARMYVDYLQVLWGKYVTGLNAKSQQESIYGPIAAGFQKLRAWIFGLPQPDALTGDPAAATETPWQWYRQNWFSLAGAATTIAGLLVLAGCWRLSRFVARKWQRSRPVLRAVAATPRRIEVEFYARLEQTLSRLGIVRELGQTPFEFAVAAGGELAENIELVRLSSLPRRVVESFYRVRFGHRQLDKVEADAVEHALLALEEGLAQAKAISAPAAAAKPLG